MAELGNARKLYVTTAEGGDYTWLVGEQNNSFTRTAEAIEVSDKSTDWAQFIAGKKGATASATVFADDTQTSPQYQMLVALSKGTTVFCFIGKLQNDTTPTEGDFFEAIVTEVSDTNDFGAVASRNISLQVTGAPTHYPTIE